MNQIDSLAADARIESLEADPLTYAELDPDKSAIIDFVEGCSVASCCDVSHLGGSDEDLLPPETRVHICAVPGRSLNDTIAEAKTLREKGFEPVPDIVAGSFSELASLDDYLGRLRGEADVREVLVIGSDAPFSGKQRPSALEVLQTDHLDRNGLTRIGIAAYPPAWRSHGAPSLNETVGNYNAWALGSDASVHFITQPCFDAEAIVAWEIEAQLAGNVLPIRVGLVGPAMPGPLANLERLCGVGPIADSAEDDRLEHLLRVSLSAPNRMVTTLARHRQQHLGCALDKVHLVVSEGLRGTALWIDAVLRGAFTVRDGGEGFTVHFHAAS